MSSSRTDKKNLKLDISNTDNFFICQHCHKAFITKNVEFFDHVLNCESEDHTDSPIGITWYTKEQLYKKNLKKVIEKEIFSTFEKRPETR